MKDLLKSILTLSVPVLVVGTIFKVGILDTYVKCNRLNISRGPAVVKIEKPVKVHSFRSDVYNYLVTVK